MPNDKHPFDVAAERLEALADKPVAGQDASPDYWELRSATDESVGDYPQALLCEPHDWDESEGLGPDGFPAVPIPEQQLQPTARWTDVLSSSLWSEGHLLNQTALAVFKQCNLGDFREYPAIVSDHTGSARPLTYLHVRNEIPPTAIDFERSEFYLAEMLGLPRGPVAIDSFEDWLEKQRRASAGKLDGCERFSRIAYKRLFFRRGHGPLVDLFRLARLGITVYVSARLKNAIVSSGISGLEIKPNKRLFADR
ncbi:hypothetical protein V5E97_08880 [Singulisphaera sp. Ch08]|uniref:RES domain-containing protein n=1 Tax=Singulisphaera sp. Ch08 TaxID=3120278 RepID=A0AAU7CLF3_9BACT